MTNQLRLAGTKVVDHSGSGAGLRETTLSKGGNVVDSLRGASGDFPQLLQGVLEDSSAVDQQAMELLQARDAALYACVTALKVTFCEQAASSRTCSRQSKLLTLQHCQLACDRRGSKRHMQSSVSKKTNTQLLVRMFFVGNLSVLANATSILESGQMASLWILQAAVQEYSQASRVMLEGTYWQSSHACCWLSALSAAAQASSTEVGS